MGYGHWSAIEQGIDPALQVTDAKIAATANIQDTKLSTITTANKVSGTAITGLPSVPSTAGALPLANGGTGQTSRTAAINALLPDQTGASGKAVVSNGADALLGYPSSLNVTGAVTGDILYYDGTKWNRLASGTSGQFLQSQGSGVAPVYSKMSFGSIT